MTGPKYSRRAVAAFYDGYGTREWDRHHKDATARLVLHRHRSFLADSLAPDQRVLDAGCGSGRFAVQCLEAGARVTLVDISKAQLEQASGRCAEVGSIEGALQADVCDLSALGDAHFDRIVCYGSVLCYLFADTPVALAELVRVCRPGGELIISVGSRNGVIRRAAGSPNIDPVDFFGRPDHWHIPSVLRRGDLPEMAEVEQPPRHFFSSQELRGLLEETGLELLGMASAPAIFTGLPERLETMASDAQAWRTVQEIEDFACQQDGLLDAGEFILARARRP